MLTWVKMFKFLNYFPQLQILTATLGYAFRPLSWFMLVFTVVMIGLSQGFHIAFGFDIEAYQNLTQSVLSLLRMAVGDFDYSELESSHYVVGPIMFWIFIVLCVRHDLVRSVSKGLDDMSGVSLQGFLHSDVGVHCTHRPGLRECQRRPYSS